MSILFHSAALASMINSEIAAVVAVLRSEVSCDDHLGHSLVRSLLELRKLIHGWKNSPNTINLVVYLQPFVDILCSGEAGALSIDVALSSVYKFLTLEAQLNPVNVKEALLSVVDAVSSCRFEGTDSSLEEVLVTKSFQVLLVCIKNKSFVELSDAQICAIANKCFRVIKAGTKVEPLQCIARQTISELVKRIFLLLSSSNSSLVKVVSPNMEVPQNRNAEAAAPGDLHLPAVLFGVPCMIEIFGLLISLLNVAEGPRSNTLAGDEDKPLFALELINSAIEMGGPALSEHPRLLSLTCDKLFHDLMKFGMSTNPRILSIVCNIVLNLYHHVLSEVKLQLEAFFSCVLLRFADRQYGSPSIQQKVAVESLVDFCCQANFMTEMYVNLDCDISCLDVFEYLVNALSSNACPSSGSFSSINLLALDGLACVIRRMAERIKNDGSVTLEFGNVIGFENYSPFWMMKCDNITDPEQWVPCVRFRKHIKRMLESGADRFNRNPAEGIKYLQKAHIFPDELDPKSLACFFRYASGLNKALVGGFIGNADKFCLHVLDEFTATFDFEGMSLDVALRLFLEPFRLPSEPQTIKRVLEAFSKRYHEQCPQTLAGKDAVLLLTYSLIVLNTDQHNSQVENKMTETDFIRSCRRINGGSDLPREFLSELYHSVLKNEIRTTPDPAMRFPEMTPSRWIDLMSKSRKTSKFIVSDYNAYIDHDMFAIMARPVIATMSSVFIHAEERQVYEICINGFLNIAKMLSCYHVEDVMDELVETLCKFTTLLNPSLTEEVFGIDVKAQLATKTVFIIVDSQGDLIRAGWRSIIACMLSLKKLSLLPNRVAASNAAAADDTEVFSEPGQTKLLTDSSNYLLSAVDTSYSGVKEHIMGLLSFDTISAHRCTLQTNQIWDIARIFTEKRFVQGDSLLHLARELIRPYHKGGTEDEDLAVFCLELLIGITLSNWDMSVIIWQCVREHITSIIQSTVVPCALVERAVFGLLKMCQRLLPHKEELANELLRLVLKLDARVAEAYCEQISLEVSHLVKTNVLHIFALNCSS